MFELFLIILFVFVLFASYLIIRNHTYMSYIPMPPCNLFLGHVMEFSNTTDILIKITEYTIKYGGIMRFYIPPGRPSVLITDPQILQQLMTSEKTLNKSIAYDFFQLWLGDGLITNGGRKWKERRKILNPCFGSVNVLKNFMKVFDKHCKILMDTLEREVGNPNVDVYPLLKMYSMDVICETAMGIETNCQQHKNLNYLHSIDKIIEVFLKRVIYPWKRFTWSFKLSEDCRQQSEAVTVVNSFVDKILAEKRTVDDCDIKNGEFVGNKQVVFIDLLLQYAKDGMLTLEDVRDEVNTFMFAGHDTTATALAFALYVLARHPDIQEKILEEQRNIFGDLRKDVNVTYVDVQKMTYLDMVIKESMRLFPTVPMISRILSDDIKLDNGIVLPKTLNMVFFIYGCHHNPKYFPEPQKFDPERFANNNVPTYSYIPFSSGYRVCIGKKFVMLQLKYCLSKIIRNFKLLPCVPEYELKLLPFISLTATNGIRISIQRRSEKV